MLSRVAESLYWTARYVERAENVTRLLDVNFHALLDARALTTARMAWQRLVAMLGGDGAYRERTCGYDATVGHRVALVARGQPQRGRACITLARENARAVREQISNEMWEAINSLYLLMRRANRAAPSHGPHAPLRTGAKRLASLPGRRRRNDGAG